MAYFNPDQAPELEQKDKSILIRFRSKEDYEDFIAKTDVIVDSKTNSINFSRLNALSDFFD